MRRRHHRGGEQPVVILDRRQIGRRLDAIGELAQPDGNADHQIVGGLVLLQHSLRVSEKAVGGLVTEYKHVSPLVLVVPDHPTRLGAKSARKSGGIRIGRPDVRSTHTPRVSTRVNRVPSATRRMV